MIYVRSSFSKTSNFKMSSVHTKTQSRLCFQFPKAPFGDGLVWTVGLRLEIKLRRCVAGVLGSFSLSFGYKRVRSSSGQSQNCA